MQTDTDGAFIMGGFLPVSWKLMRPYIGVQPPTVRAVSSKCSPQFKPDQVITAEKDACDGSLGSVTGIMFIYRHIHIHVYIFFRRNR